MLLRLRFSCSTIQVFSWFHLLKHSLFRLCCVTEWEGLLHKQQCLQHFTDCSSSAEPGRLVFLPVPFEWQLLTRVLSFVALDSVQDTPLHVPFQSPALVPAVQLSWSHQIYFSCLGSAVLERCILLISCSHSSPSFHPVACKPMRVS